MDVTNRLVLFLVVMMNGGYYFSLGLFPKKRAAIPSMICTGFFSAILYLLSGVCVYGWFSTFGTFGTVSVTTPVMISGITLIVSLAGMWLITRFYESTMEERKLVVVGVLLIALASFPNLLSGYFLDYLLHVGVISAGYFFFSAAFAGVQDRLSLAPIPSFLKGLPLSLLILFLFYLSFSFFNGVFFGELF